MAQLVEIRPQEMQEHVCWWPGDASIQGTSRHEMDMVLI